MICMYCGETIPDDVLFCPCCRKEIDRRRIPPEIRQPKETRVITARKKKDGRRAVPAAKREMILNCITALSALSAPLSFLFPLAAYSGTGFTASVSGFRIMFSDGLNLEGTTGDVVFVIAALWFIFLLSLTVTAAGAVLIRNRVTGGRLFKYRNRNRHMLYSTAVITAVNCFYLLFGIYLTSGIREGEGVIAAHTSSWWPLVIQAVLLGAYYAVLRFTKPAKAGTRKRKQAAS